MDKKLTNILRYGLWIAIAALLVYFSFRNLNWKDFGTALRECRWGFVILSMLLGAAYYLACCAAAALMYKSEHRLNRRALKGVFGFPLFMVPVVTLSKRIRKWSRKALERFSVVGSRIHEILTCIRVVKAYNTEEFENVRYEATNRRLLGSTMRAVRWGLFVGPAVETVGILLLCGFLAWCFTSHVTIANILPMLAPLLLIYKPIKQLSNLQVSIETAQASLQRICSILDVDMELPEKADAAPKTEFSDKVVFDDNAERFSVSLKGELEPDTAGLRRAVPRRPRGPRLLRRRGPVAKPGSACHFSSDTKWLFSGGVCCTVCRPRKKPLRV